MVLLIRPPGGLLRPGSGAAGVDGAGVDGVGEEGETKTKDERDKERWARLKRLKQVFRVRRKPKEGEKEKGKGK